MHRAGIIHRDIKPDNVILEGGGSLKLIDLGVVRVPGLEEFPPENIPGTAAYMAPEMFAGEPGNEATDIYALGVTMFRAFTGEYPYGNVDADQPAAAQPADGICRRCGPIFPAWLEAALARAIAADPAKRFDDMIEFALVMEAGTGPRARAKSAGRAPSTSAPRCGSGKASPPCWRWRSWRRCWCVESAGRGAQNPLRLVLSPPQPSLVGADRFGRLCP